MIAKPQDTIEVRVRSITRLADACCRIELEAPDRSPLPGGEPGSHIGVVLPNGIERQYSLLESGEEFDRYAIGVKLDAESRGGSRYLVNELRVGELLEVQRPRNNFPLEVDAPRSVFIAGGIGITPIWCMIARLESLGRPWELHYASRSRSDAMFLEELQGRDNVHLHFDDEAGGVLAVAGIVRAANKDAHLYCCGPAPMLAAFEEAAKTAGVPAEQVHVEYFTQRYEAATDSNYVVELARSGQQVSVQPGQTILDALRKIGIDASYSCEEGICGACETRVLEGVPDHRDSILSEKERQENRTMFICCSGAKSDKLVLDL